MTTNSKEELKLQEADKQKILAKMQKVGKIEKSNRNVFKSLHISFLKRILDARMIYITKGETYFAEWVKTSRLGDISLGMIGYIMGVSRERVRQIETTALRKLKHPHLAKDLKKYRDNYVQTFATGY